MTECKREVTVEWLLTRLEQIEESLTNLPFVVPAESEDLQDEVIDHMFDRVCARVFSAKILLSDAVSDCVDSIDIANAKSRATRRGGNNA